MSERDRGRWARPDPPDNEPAASSAAAYCTRCGRGAGHEDRFCAGCGHALAQPNEAVGSPTADEHTQQLQRAHYLLVTGQVHEAIPALEQLRDARPDQPVLLAYLGVAYLRAARVTEAQLAIEEAIGVLPLDFTCRVAYGEYFARLGFYDRAVAQLDAALGVPAPSDEAYRAAFELRRYCHEKTKGLVYRRTALPSLPGFFRRSHRDGGRATPAAPRRSTP